MTGEIRERQIRGRMKFRNLHAEEEEEEKAEEPPSDQSQRSEEGGANAWTGGKRRLTHQFVVLVHIFLLQGVKVAATDEGGGGAEHGHTVGLGLL